MRKRSVNIWSNTFLFINDLLLNLALQDDIRGCASEGCCASDAGRVTHAQTHPFGQVVVLCIDRFFPGLLQ